MSRWLFVLVLSVASMATAWAQSSPIVETTTRAYNASAAAERRVGDLANQRTALAQRYEDELRSIDRLKNQRASWRRDRELRDQLSEANETAKTLATVTSDLAAAQAELATARRVLLAAIDTELALAPAAPRKAQLDRARAQITPARRTAHRIVLPDLQIDPLADPEELDQQAAALRASEAELTRQIIGLDTQAKELERVAMLRKQHDRTNEMDRREDNTSHRNATTANRGGEAAASDGNSPQAPAPDTRPGESGAPPPSFEAEASVVLAEVVDTSTLDSLQRSQRSADPAQRADIARRVRDAVTAKRDQLRTKRAQIESRAKQLRTR
jgi:hypothetical protein